MTRNSYDALREENARLRAWVARALPEIGSVKPDSYERIEALRKEGGSLCSKR